MICKECRKATDGFKSGLLNKDEAEQLHETRCDGCFCQHKLDAEVTNPLPEREHLGFLEQCVLENKPQNALPEK